MCQVIERIQVETKQRKKWSKKENHDVTFFVHFVFQNENFLVEEQNDDDNKRQTRKKKRPKTISINQELYSIVFQLQ